MERTHYQSDWQVSLASENWIDFDEPQKEEFEYKGGKSELSVLRHRLIGQTKEIKNIEKVFENGSTRDHQAIK